MQRRQATVVGAVVVAAGSGDRLGRDIPKALVEVAGRPLVDHAIRVLVEAGITQIVVVCPPGHRPAMEQAHPAGFTPKFVDGGRTRTESVRSGLRALPPQVTAVAVHDAARPLVPVEVVRRALAAMTEGVLAAAPALPVADTLKRVHDDRVSATEQRDGLVAVQTPQVFPREVLETVLVPEAPAATDDLALVEAAVADGRLDGSVIVVPGSPFAHKVTYPEDLEFVEALARGLVATRP